jgi:hypothetical protein
MFMSMQVLGQPATGPVKEHLERRLSGAVKPYGSRLAGVALRATPGPRRNQVTCRVAVSLDAGVFTGTARGANVYFAAEEAIARATRAADKAVRREQGVLLGLLGLAATAGNAR